MSDVVNQTNQTSEVSKTSEVLAGEVLNGFKDTELGPLPVDWEVVELGDVCEKPQYGYTASASQAPVGPRFLRITDIQEGYVNWPTVPFCKIDDEQFGKYELQPDDLVIARIGATTGKTYRVVECPPATFASYLIRVRSISSSVRADFLTHFTQTEIYWKQINASKGGRLKQGVNIPILKSLLLPLPPLPEQRRIAHVLNTIQRQIAAQGTLIAAAREVKRSLMQRLFTYGPGPEPAPTKETEIGEVPEHWEVVELGSVTESSAFGPRFSGKLYNEAGNVATLRTTDLDANGNINYLTMPRAKLDLRKFQKHFLQPGDFMVTRSGTCGIATVFDSHSIPVLPGAFLIRFRLKPVVKPLFLRGYFNSDLGRKRVLLLASGAVQKNISGTSLKSFHIPLPPLNEQDEIAHILTTADRKIAAEEQRQAALQELFKSMLHQLMTGQIRLLASDFGSFENFRSLEKGEA